MCRRSRRLRRLEGGLNSFQLPHFILFPLMFFPLRRFFYGISFRKKCKECFFKPPFLLNRQKKRGFVSPKKRRSRGSSRRKRLPTLPLETPSDARSRRREQCSATHFRRAVRLHVCHRTLVTLLPGSTALSWIPKAAVSRIRERTSTSFLFLWAI